MDGFAVRVYREGPVRPYTLLGEPLDTRPAARRTLRAGEATPIATGARLPAGADAVVRIEAARVDRGQLRVSGSVHPGQDVIPRGESIRRGDPILRRGERVGPYHLSALIADGVRSLPIYDIRVVILPVGDELRGPHARGPGTVSDLIGPVIHRLFDFARVRTLSSVPDDVRRLTSVLAREARRSDLVITIGGASVGTGDVTKGTVAAMGEVLFEGVRANVLKRGGAALIGGTPVLVLPGQVVSAVTIAHEHALHLLGRMTGGELRRFERATLGTAIAVNHRMDSTFLFHLHDGRADPLPWGVARIGALLRANAFGVLERGRPWAAGDEVEVQRLEHAAIA
jgi:molybdopterin molybdotransferase